MQSKTRKSAKDMCLAFVLLGFQPHMYVHIYILIGVLGVSLYLFQLCLSCSPLLSEQCELHPVANFMTTVFVVYFQSGILNISRKQKRLLLMEKEQLISGVSHSYEESGEHETDPLLPGRRHHIN